MCYAAQTLADEVSKRFTEEEQARCEAQIDAEGEMFSEGEFDCLVGYENPQKPKSQAYMRGWLSGLQILENREKNAEDEF